MKESLIIADQHCPTEAIYRAVEDSIDGYTATLQCLSDGMHQEVVLQLDEICDGKEPSAAGCVYWGLSPSVGDDEPPTPWRLTVTRKAGDSDV